PRGGVAVRRGVADDAAFRGRGRARHADAARAARAAAAVRPDRRPPEDARRGRQAVRRDPRADPADRGEGAAQAAAPVAVEEAAGLPGVTGPPNPRVLRQSRASGACFPRVLLNSRETT